MTATEWAHYFHGHIVVSQSDKGGISVTMPDVPAFLEKVMADAYLRGQQAAIESAAKTVDGWHISKGGYGLLAEAIRALPVAQIDRG